MDIAAAPDDSLWRASFPADHTAGGAWNEVSVSFTPSFLPTFVKLRLLRSVQALLTLPLVFFEWQTSGFE